MRLNVIVRVCLLGVLLGKASTFTISTILSWPVFSWAPPRGRVAASTNPRVIMPVFSLLFPCRGDYLRFLRLFLEEDLRVRQVVGQGDVVDDRSLDGAAGQWTGLDLPGGQLELVDE